jgi:hypothetical protein
MKRQPIGYWIKLLDRLIEASFEKTIGTQQLTRRHWQALSVIRSAPVSRLQLDEALAPFLAEPRATEPRATEPPATEPSATMAPVIDDLRERGWIADIGGRLSLTSAGEAAVSALYEVVSSNRAVVADGITEAQYDTTIDTLARMCANLQGPTAQTPAG